MEDVAVAALPTAPAPVFSPATAGLTLIAAAAAEPIVAVVAGAMEGVPITLSVPPVRTTAPMEDDELPTGEEGGEAEAAGSPCSVNSDCSSIASAVVFEDSAASAATVEAEARVAAGGRSVFAVECVPLWGYTSICGRRPEMEDAVVAVPRFFGLPLWMLTGSNMVDGLDPISFRLPAHFFGVYDGHGGAQVADYCRDRLHAALVEELSRIEGSVSGANLGAMEFKKQWEKAFVDCFTRVDDEVAGKASSGGGGDVGTSNVAAAADPVAPETVGTTAVVSVICSSHIIVSNCGDSRAVLCRGKQPVPLSVDHKPNREDEYARIEAAGGKVIQWNGYRVFGVLAMSRSIGDRYLKPWIIPVPEVTIVPRAKDDECLILASDGLWDVLSNEEVCDVARKRILLWHKKNGGNLPSAQRSGDSPDPAAQAAAECLSKLALQKGSKDNITVIVVDLKAQRKFKSKTNQLPDGQS